MTTSLVVKNPSADFSNVEKECRNRETEELRERARGGGRKVGREGVKGGGKEREGS